jgi:hypothetical protein
MEEGRQTGLRLYRHDSALRCEKGAKHAAKKGGKRYVGHALSSLLKIRTNFPRGQDDSAVLRIDYRIATVVLTPEMARNLRNRGTGYPEAGYGDILRSTFQNSDQYEFYPTLGGFFVPSSSQRDPIAQIEESVADAGGITTITFVEDLIFEETGGIRTAFPLGLRGTELGGCGGVVATSHSNEQHDGPVPVSNATMTPFETGFHLPPQSENYPLQFGSQNRERHYETTVLGFSGPFQNDFDFLPSAVNTTPSRPAPDQQNSYYRTAAKVPLLADFGQEGIPDQLAETYQREIKEPFLDDFDLGARFESFTFNTPIQEMSFSEAVASTSSQGTNPSWNELSLLGHVEPSRGAPPADPEKGFCDDFDLLGSVPTSSQESPSTQTTYSTPSNNLVTTPSSANTSPDRHFCLHCLATFGRPNDLKRHQGKHLPKRIHCRQPGCGRGRKGFYRRDKLKAHEKQVHKMHLNS